MSVYPKLWPPKSLKKYPLVFPLTTPGLPWGIKFRFFDDLQAKIVPGLPQWTQHGHHMQREQNGTNKLWSSSDRGWTYPKRLLISASMPHLYTAFCLSVPRRLGEALCNEKNMLLASEAKGWALLRRLGAVDRSSTRRPDGPERKLTWAKTATESDPQAFLSDTCKQIGITLKSNN